MRRGAGGYEARANKGSEREARSVARGVCPGGRPGVMLRRNDAGRCAPARPLESLAGKAQGARDSADNASVVCKQVVCAGRPPRGGESVAVIFAKTSKGQAEIANRSGALGPRFRRVLIFVDGKRPVAELREMLQHDDLQHTLSLLEEQGFIEMAGRTAKQGGLAPLLAQPSISAFRQHPPGDDSLRLQQARNFMLNTVNAFVGALGTSSLQDRMAAARSQDELRDLFDEWYRAIVSSRDGRRQAEHLRGKLLEVI